MDVNLKSLIGKLNRTCHKALEDAAGACVSRTNYHIEIEHWLSKLLDDPNNDIGRIMRQFEINPDRVNAGLTNVLDRLKTGSSRQPSISPDVIAAAKDAWLVSTVEFGYGRVRSGTVLLAILNDSQLASRLRDASREFDRISPEALKESFTKIVAESSEEAEMIAEPGAAAGAPSSKGIGARGKTTSLDQFCIDLTQRAREGAIDPVLGRDNEIRQIVDILTRRRQNNPILTGEAGVGKTAVVEGFALRIAAGDVPPSLQNVELRTLDLGLLQAGAGVKGEFENRLKSVIDEVKSSPTPIILFIDEAHTMIGAGGQEGGSDAANLLKPALARGELRTIAATTWAEYKKYFEKDAALARRFQVVKVEEPTEPICTIMMRGLTETLENHHKVPILDEAIDASVHFSARYISGRQLPDKAVSLLDTACARVSLSQSATPPSIEDTTRTIENLKTELRILEGEQAAGSDHAVRIEEIKEKQAEAEKTLGELRERWDTERELVGEIREIRTELRGNGTPAEEEELSEEDQKTKEAVDKLSESKPKEPLSPEKIEELRGKLDTLTGQLHEAQGEDPLIHPFVDSQAIASVIADWTGIPVGRMLADEIKTVLNLKETMGKMVVGQDHGLEAIARRIHTARANMDDPNRPIGVFLLVGPSGVGKTETAITLSELLYGGERNMVTINMSEYQEAHTVSGLKGSPPGYVGYGEGGVLTEAVRQKPYSVVLLDEFEKAHQDVWELFYQVFDKGTLEDGTGRVIDFRNTVILCTSNVATDTITSLCADPETRPDPGDLVTAIRPELEKAFPLALLGRMVVSAYYPISDEVMKLITKLKLGKIVRRIKGNHSVEMTYDESLLDEVVSRCTEVASGARNVDHILTNTLLPEVSREFLARMAENKEVSAINVTVGDEGDFVYQFTETDF
ncbi:Chaperone protein ClpB [Planctomycetes bacterium Pan216]|uniref:Chaperone protein ClpB n=1 Tax=Kolteria novifilia TaxID=2527975 RepID=A0A518AYF2_9BACT|nr:Chaperone protein ClpB [Planctomycetes bacterium Pan216]